MTDSFVITLLVQACSAALIGWLLLYFARIYQRMYLHYWSYSFFSLTLFLLGSFFAILLVQLNHGPSSTLRLINLFILTTAGYLQIGFLVIGTQSLVNGTLINKKTLFRILVICVLIALIITLFKNWSPDEVSLRYFTRIGLRYLVAGLACLGTAVFIIRNDPKPLIGKQLVTVGFFIYGFEMTFLGWLTAENHFLNGSELLFILAPYHGLFELLLYPMIGVGLIMWLLEVERIQSKQAFNKLKHLNTTDGLTGLPNQQALKTHLKQWANVATPKDKITMTLFGVDQMARFNDGEGIQKGDQLLVSLAKRLEFLCTGYSFYGRLYGDVFVLLLNNYSKAEIEKIKSLRKKLSRPFKLESKTFFLEVSAGSTKITVDMDHKTMLNRANQALQSAKASGGKQVKTYRKGIKLPHNPDISFENELRTAFKQHQFEIYYQPIWTNKNTIVCFEALIRWNHPTRGILSPTSFLYLVQQLGLTVDLDFWVTEQAFKQIQKWKKINADAANITVNLSADTIQNDGIVEHLVQCSLKYKVIPQHITVEITENTAMHNIESGTNTLNEIRKLGHLIAIDDFGTGYSSLNYLRTFPSDVIKFDRTFVSDTSNRAFSQEILKALVPLCHQLKKKVIVEGVETKLQFDQLAQFNIDGYQGYYLSRPVQLSEASKLLIISKKSGMKSILMNG